MSKHAFAVNTLAYIQYIHIFGAQHTHAHTRTHARTHILTHIHIHTRVHARTSTHMQTHTLKHPHTHTRTHTRTHTHTHKHTHTHTHTRTHTHAHNVTRTLHAGSHHLGGCLVWTGGLQPTLQRECLGRTSTSWCVCMGVGVGWEAA